MKSTLKMSGMVLSIAAMMVFAGMAIADDMSGMSGMSHDSKTTEKSNAKSISISGEVVDTGCYVGHDAKGEDHASCAKMCIQGGIPAAIATSSGKLYIILGEGHKSPADVVKGYEGKQVKVTGKVTIKGGSNFITVSKIAEAKANNTKMESNKSKDLKNDEVK